jgi:hypothetical protein
MAEIIMVILYALGVSWVKGGDVRESLLKH